MSICNILDVDIEKMCSSRKDRKLFNAKVIIANVLRNDYKLSSSEAGEYINRNHASILYYGKKYDDLLKYDASFREMTKKIVDIKLEIKDDIQLELEEEFIEVTKYHGY